MPHEDNNFMDSIKKLSNKSENEVSMKVEQYKDELAKQHALDYAAASESKKRLSQFAIEPQLDVIN